MVFPLSLLLPILVLSLWLFWRLSPPRPDGAAVRRFNVVAIAVMLMLAALVAWYVRDTMMASTDHASWPLIAAFYLMGVIPVSLAVAGLVRKKLYGTKEAAKPLELTRDLSNTRF